MRNEHGAASRGFSLVEVVLALGIAAFCLITIFGLLPLGVNSNQLSIEQVAAGNLATAVMADLQAIPKGAATAPDQTYFSPRFAVPAPPLPKGTKVQSVLHYFYLREDGLLADANNTIDSGANLTLNPRYRVTVMYAVPPMAQAAPVYFSVPTEVIVTWPAVADPTPVPPAANASPSPTPPRNFSGSFEAAASLNRN